MCLTNLIFVILGFRRDVDEICALLGYYAASCGNPLRTFRDNGSVPSSRVKKFLALLLIYPKQNSLNLYGSEIRVCFQQQLYVRYNLSLRFKITAFMAI
jgi:hypothetical protein